MFLSIKPFTQARNQLGTPEGRRVLWEWRKFFKLCRILSNYVIFFQGGKNFSRGDSPPCLRACFHTACTFLLDVQSSTDKKLATTQDRQTLQSLCCYCA